MIDMGSRPCSVTRQDYGAEERRTDQEPARWLPELSGPGHARNLQPGGAGGPAAVVLEVRVPVAVLGAGERDLHGTSVRCR